MAEAITNGPRDNKSQAFTITNFTENLSFNSGNSSNEQLGDVLATLIQELKAKGIIEATIA